MFDRMAMGSHRPLGTVVVPIAELSQGDLVVAEHRVCEVIEVRERSEGGRPRVLVVIPIGSDERVYYGAHRDGVVWRYIDREHYPVCNRCHEPVPCREVSIEWEVQDADERTRRYEISGICPACEEPVTHQQVRQTWPENMIVPNGDAVTFHLRKKCETEALAYDQLWMKAGHASRLGQVAAK